MILIFPPSASAPPRYDTLFMQQWANTLPHGPLLVSHIAAAHRVRQPAKTSAHNDSCYNAPLPTQQHPRGGQP